MTKGSEIAGSFVVVFEKVRVDVEFVEEDFGNWFVATFGEPGAAVVAAAEMNADGEVVGSVAD